MYLIWAEPKGEIRHQKSYSPLDLCSATIIMGL
jgi:hypothetical protein